MKTLREIHLAARPVGMPTQENFRLVERAAPELKQDEIAVKNLYLTVDPYMRGRMNDVKSYIPPFQIGEVMEGGAVGEVVQSQNEKFPVGSKVLSSNGWRDGWVGAPKGVMKIDETIDAPPSAWLGALGMPGLTACFSNGEVEPVARWFSLNVFYSMSDLKAKWKLIFGSILKS